MEMFQKVPSVIKNSLRKPQFQNNQRSLQSVIYRSHLLQYKHTCHRDTILFSTILTYTTAALYTEVSFQWTVWAWGALLILRKGRGWFVNTSIFHSTAMELLERDSQKTAVKMTTNLIIIFTITLRYTPCISYRPSTNEKRAKVWTFPSRLLAFRTVTTSVPGPTFFDFYLLNIKNILTLKYNRWCILYTSFSYFCLTSIYVNLPSPSSIYPQLDSLRRWW
jgi:hypothetical protein